LKLAAAVALLIWPKLLLPSVMPAELPPLEAKKN